MTTTAYIFFICGHIRVAEDQTQPYTAPFDHVLKLPSPILDNEDLAKVVEGRLTEELSAELRRVTDGRGQLLGDPMVRQVSLLHTVLIDKEGRVARVLS